MMDFGLGASDGSGCFPSRAERARYQLIDFMNGDHVIEILLRVACLDLIFVLIRSSVRNSVVCMPPLCAEFRDNIALATAHSLGC